MSPMNDLFDGFDVEDVAAASRCYKAELDGAFNMRAIMSKSRVETRSAESDNKLFEVLPKNIEPGTSWHVLSGGDIDALSYLRVIIGNTGYFNNVTISSWRISMPAAQQLHNWVDGGQIESLNLVVDQRFARLSLDVLTYIQSWIGEFGGSISVTRTHAKLTLMANTIANKYYVLESSANLNINKRLEQTTIYNDKNLYDFYKTGMVYVAEKSYAA